MIPDRAIFTSNNYYPSSWPHVRPVYRHLHRLARPDSISLTSPLSPTLSASARTSRSIGRPKGVPSGIILDTMVLRVRVFFQIGKREAVMLKCGHHVAGKFQTIKPETAPEEVTCKGIQRDGREGG